MKLKYYLIIASISHIFFSCLEKNIPFEYTISNNTKSLASGEILFTKNDYHYFYDLKIADHFYLFFDDRSDTALWIYRKESPIKIATTMKRSLSKEGVWMPLFTKEVYPSNEKSDTLFFVDNNLYYKKIILNSENNNINISTFYTDNYTFTFSTDFNITNKETYAIPISRNRKNPFYFFNPDSGYYWVDPSASIEKELPQNNLSYTNTICLNESQNTIVSAYRFTNRLSFYNSNGTLRTTIKFGDKSIIPQTKSDMNELDILNTQKCFTYICGTPKYVYCLYDGSTDFTAPSKIVVLKWNGKHVATWQVDRNLRAIAVDKEDKFILAIASNDNGQDIIKYELKE